jgi:ubiquinone/menaquinone biosynthesis C-methylase UbiE
MAVEHRWYGEAAWAYYLGTTTRASPLYWLVRPTRRAVAASLDLAPGDTVVDIGCGTGANVPHLRARVGTEGHVIGVDRSPAVLAWARRLVRRRRWGNVSLVTGDAATPPVAGPVDGVCATFLLAVRDVAVERVVREWAARLAPGGRFVVVVAGPGDGALAPVTDRALAAYVSLFGGWGVGGREALAHFASRNERLRSALAAVSTDVRHDTHLGGLLHRYTATVD